jgi:CHAT domain-containing protein/predicted negative regulator of RcsB-dependent stress response
MRCSSRLQIGPLRAAPGCVRARARTYVREEGRAVVRSIVLAALASPLLVPAALAWGAPGPAVDTAAEPSAPDPTRPIDELSARQQDAQALELSEQARARAPSDLVLLDQAARLYVELQRAAEGEAALSAALPAASTTTAAAASDAARAFVAGAFLYHQERFTEALPKLQGAADALRAAGDSLALAPAELRLGECLRELKRRAEAKTTLQEAHRLAARSPHARLDLQVTEALARCLQEEGDNDRARAVREEALARARALHDPLSVGIFLNGLAALQLRAGLYARAAQTFLEASRQAHAVGAIDDELARRLRAGNALVSLAQLDSAQAIYERALDDARRAGVAAREVQALTRMGSLLRQRGDPAQALALFAQAHAVADAHHVALLDTWPTLLAEGNALVELGRYKEALAALESIRAITESQDPRSHASVLNSIGNCHQHLGALAAARAAYDQAVAIMEQIKDYASVGRYMTNIGNCYIDEGRFEQGLQRYLKAQPILEQTHQPIPLAINHLNIATVYERFGKNELALEHARQARALTEQAGSTYNLAGALITVGEIHARMGRQQEARAEFEQGLQASRAVGQQGNELRALVALGTVDEEEGHFDDAELRWTSVLQAAHETGETTMENRALVGLGDVAMKRGQFDLALQRFQQARAVALTTGSPRRLVDPVSGIAQALARAGRSAEALAAYEEAVGYVERLREGTGAEEERWELFDQFAPLYAGATVLLAEMAQQPDSLPPSGQAGQLSPSGPRAQLPPSGQRGQPVEPGRPAQPQRAEQAFSFAERCRARTFLDHRLVQGIDVGHGLSAELLDSKHANLAQYNLANSRLLARCAQLAAAGGAGTPERATLEQDSVAGPLLRDLQRLNEEYARIEGSLRPEQNRLTGLQDTGPARLEQVAAALGHDGLLLEYFVQDDVVLLMTVDGRARLRLYRIAPEALPKARDLAAMLRPSSSPRSFAVAAYAALAHELYHELLEPAAEQLRGAAHLVVVPDGPLAYLPFEALLTREPAGGGADSGTAASTASAGSVADLAELPYLFLEHEIAYVPSATALVRLQQERVHHPPLARAGAQTLVLANPVYAGVLAGVPAEGTTVATANSESDDSGERGRALREYRFTSLPYTARESAAIERLLGSSNVVRVEGKDAREEYVKAADLTRFARIHFATHAMVDDEVPQLSAVVLAQDDDPTEDGFLTMREIYDLKLDADLVVLSACSTAEGRSYRGEGVIGLARAFLAAGAASVLVTLWPVNDVSTAAFMESFYAALHAGRSSEQALRQARLDLLRSDRPAWRLPMHWAPFALVGEVR